MHRFLWDLAYPEPDVLEHEYPISAIYHDTPRYPLGAAVLPGEYKVVLTVGGKSYTQPLEIRMDPRMKTSPEDLRRQFELDRKIAAALHQDYEALQQVRSLRAQLKALTGVEAGATQVAKNAERNKKLAAIRETANELEEKAATIEGEEGEYDTHYLSTPEGRSLARLNSGLSVLVSVLDGADAAPTTQQVAMFGELEEALKEKSSAWGKLMAKDIPELNDKLKKAGQPLIDSQKPVPADAAQTTSQDKDRDME